MKLALIAVFALTLSLLALSGCDEKSKTATSASPPPVAPAAAAVPGTQPASNTSAAAPPINTKCPVSGDPVDPTDPKLDRVVYGGKTYVFCCKDCKPEFNANPTKYVKGE